MENALGFVIPPSYYAIKVSSEIGMQMPVFGGVGIQAMLSQLSRNR